MTEDIDQGFHNSAKGAARTYCYQEEEKKEEKNDFLNKEEQKHNKNNLGLITCTYR